MAVALIGALIYYNFVDVDSTQALEPTEPTGTVSDVIQGNQVGNLCFSYPMEVYGGGTISVEDTRGTITILNFWGTWCTPCVAELINEFPLIAQEYGDKISIIAVHSYDEYGKDVPAFIEENFSDLPAIFCRDGTGDLYYQLLGGGQAWPGTVILDENGIISAVIQRSTTYEELKGIIDSLLTE